MEVKALCEFIFMWLFYLQSGYYMPDVEVVRERYRVLYPPIHNLSPYGYYIWRECHRFDTFKLEKMGPRDPVGEYNIFN